MLNAAVAGGEDTRIVSATIAMQAPIFRMIRHHKRLMHNPEGYS
jgi:hypothetical protein